MEKYLKDAIFKQVEEEPFAKIMGIKLVKLEEGYSLVEMVYHPEKMDNMFKKAHGGAIFSLIDEAFETVGQTGGFITVALNVNITYVSSPEAGVTLKAEAQELSKTRKTGSYSIIVTDENDKIIATCQALSYITNKPLPFIAF